MMRSAMLQTRAKWIPCLALALAFPLLNGCGGDNGTGGNGGNGNGGTGGGGTTGGGGNGGTGGGGSGGTTPTVPPMVPFGSHPMPYPGDVLKPSGGQQQLDMATATAYDDWKAKYVKQGCGGYYVLSGGGTGSDVGDEVSEGHGYGMLITVMMAGHDPDAQKIFNGMYDFFHKYPTGTHKNLMAWTVDVAGGCKIPANAGSDSATDGDLDVAYALLLADKQWPGAGYGDKAQLVISDVKRGDMNATTHLPVFGDAYGSDDPQYYGTRPSDFMLDHFRAFAKSGDSSWMQSVDAVYTLVNTMQTMYAPSTGLVPDFIADSNTAPKPAPPMYLEGANDGDYDYNSCRVPWRLATDYIVSSDARAKTALSKMNAWIMSVTKNDPSMIMDGYKLDGTKDSGQSGTSKAFSSPFGVAAMVGSSQDWLDKIWLSRAIDEDYYADTITMLSMIVMSGNWWTP